MKLVWQEMEHNIKLAVIKYDDAEIKLIFDVSNYEASGTLAHIVNSMLHCTNTIALNEMAKFGINGWDAEFKIDNDRQRIVYTCITPEYYK